jgi:hypothetical protein
MYQNLLTRKASMPRSMSIEGTTDPRFVLTGSSYSESIKKAKKYHSVGSYFDHVSFFVDPIPSGVIGKLFENHHPTWYDGNMLHEHIVETEDIPKGFLYDVVETPLALLRMDAVEKWIDTDAFVVKYMQQLAHDKRLTGEIGKDKQQLDNQIKLFIGGTEQAYIAAKKRPDWEENRVKYAACVPHVMVYPPGGRIPVRTVNKIVIGNDARKPFNVSLTW